LQEEIDHEERDFDATKREDKLKTAEITKLVNKTISKFYPIDKDEELEHDIDTDDLEEISEDEKNDIERDELMIDDNRQVSQESAKNIHIQMA
jgi:predicted phosphoribosyltransferase